MQIKPEQIKAIVRSENVDPALYLIYLKLKDNRTIAETSLISGFSENVLRKAIRDGEIPVIKGLINQRDLEQWEKRNAIPINLHREIVRGEKELRMMRKDFLEGKIDEKSNNIRGTRKIS